MDDRGWTLVQPALDDETAIVTTPDNYTLRLHNIGNRDGSLSITATSPCFPATGLVAPPHVVRPLATTEIKHP